MIPPCFTLDELFIPLRKHLLTRSEHVSLTGEEPEGHSKGGIGNLKSLNGRLLRRFNTNVYPFPRHRSSRH